MRKIVHCYFTDGFFGWGKMLLESLKVSNNEKYEVIFSTRNLSSDKIKELHSLYSNLTVLNKNLDYAAMAKQANVPKEKLLQYKKTIENKKVNDNIVIWKLMISAGDRQKEVQEVVHSLEDGDILMHFDADCFIRNSLDPFFEIAEKNDYTGIMNVFAQRERGEKDNPRMGIIGCFQCYNINDRSRKFADQWVAEIENVPLLKRPIRFGQITAYRAFIKLENELSWGDLPKNKISIASKEGENKILWSFCVGDKNQSLQKMKNVLNRLKKQKGK